MSASNLSSGLCLEVEERLSEVLDGSAPATLFEHIAECDECRDRRHEASLAVEFVAGAGADFRPSADFAEQLLARAAAARPGAPMPAEPPPSVETLSRGQAARASSEPAPDAAKGGTLAGDPGLETNPTLLAPVAVSPTIIEESSPTVTVTAPGSGTVSATSHHSVESAESDRPRESGRASEPAPVKVVDAAKASADPAPAKTSTAAPPVVSIFRGRAVVAGLVGALAAAAAIAFYVRSHPTDRTKELAEAPWSGKVASVSRASSDKTGGLEACDASGACAPVATGADIRAGMTLRTDARTRAHIALADGTELAIDRASQVELASGENRTARVGKGTIVADVAKVDGASPAHFVIPQGDVEVIGTKLALSADEERASVEVARGEVRVRSRSGKVVSVRAGEEATMGRDSEAVVASTTSLADVMEWSDRSPEEVDAPVLRGLGELRARKPGQTKERDRAVRLAKHAVKVRIVDVVARTEVDETFANDTDEELEGIFRFPLPPGAQIERLALEVDGKLIEGAFVDRDRGAAIWRGVIQNAAPKSPKPKEEIIWVPGPWRDPALLEWQRGGRFELKIFPIPKRGSRRVVLTYTQIVDQAAGVRRFTYPLAHDTSGTTKVDSFDLDLQVLGNDKKFGLQTRGYDLRDASSDGGGERRTMSASGFTPAGDLSVEYALPDRDREVTAWAYKVDGGIAPATDVTNAKTAEEKAAAEAALAISSDASPYVAIAVRPKLPRWQEAKERVHVIVVDSSRSMVGERFARATRLASSIVREMDRHDSFITIACDTICRSMTSDGGSTARPAAPGAAAAGDVERFLGSIEPDGGSDLFAAMQAARSAAGSLGGKELRVLYLGDGTPTVGPTRMGHIETAVRGAMPAGDGAVIAVALGADADMPSLQALARGGGGVVVPYVPGQKVSSAALDVLGAAYGVVMRDPEIELPSGLTQVTPARLDPIRAGGEAFIVARMSGGSDIGGNIKLKGRVAGERFEQTYPVKILATSSAGNAFVPRLYAAAKIAELERVGGELQKPTIVELSKRFAVASKFTSLLVLESEAMFKAFGLDRGSVAPAFTGEEQAQSSSGDAEGEKDEDLAAATTETETGTGQGFGAGHGRLGGSHREKKESDTKGAPRPDDISGDDFRGPVAGATRGFDSPGNFAAPSVAPTMAPPMQPSPMEERRDSAFEPRPTTPPPSPAKKPATSTPSGQAVAADPFFDESWNRARRQRLVPMKRVFDRNATFEALNTLARQNASRLVVVESALATTPDSRDKTAELYALYATSGRIGEAQELTARWSGRDALDPDALTARADLAARQGDRARAVRILGGLADVRPGDRATQVRLADLQEAAGNQALACEHRIALAGIAMSDAKIVTDAVRCSRAQGMNDLASQLRADTTDKVRESLDRLLATSPLSPTTVALRGDVQISAQWSGGEDLDIALIDAQGKRFSWLGSPSKAGVTVRDATSTRSETLAIANLPAGNYIIEITRASGERVGGFNQGDVTLRLVNDTRKLPFTLSGPRAELGSLRLFFTSRLVPADFGVGGFR